MWTKPPRARSVVCTIHSTAHPVDPVRPIILQLIHSSVRAADDPSSLSVRRPSPTVRPNIRSTDNEISQPDGRPSPFPMHPVMPTILSLIHPIIHAFADPIILSVGRPSPTFHPIVRPIDDPTILPFIRPIIDPNDDLLIKSVGRPSPTHSDQSVHPTIFHGNHLNRPPDLTPNPLESSEEGYSTTMSEWPATLQGEMETFLFHTVET